jgi:hypothetical protein
MLIAFMFGTILILMAILLINQRSQHIKLMAKFNTVQEAFDALTAEVAKNTTVEKSALALIQGFAAQLAAAVAAAQAAGATAAQLQGFSDLQDTLTANDTELAAAVQAGTSANPTP